MRTTEKGRSIAYSIVCKLYKRALIEKCFSMQPDEQQFGEDLLCLCLCILESRRIVLSRQFDKIIIAINEEEAAKEVTVMLLEQGQPKEKIMWVKPKGVLIDE